MTSFRFLRGTEKSGLVSRRLVVLMPAIALLGFFGSLSSVGADELRERTGHAYDTRSGALIYTEHHQEWWKDGRILRDTVTYRSPDDIIIAEKHVDFRNGEHAPDFLLRNVVTGHSEAARQASEMLSVRFQEATGQPERTELLHRPEDAIVDAGFDRFIESNWEALTRGEVFIRPFLVPSRLEFMDFQIRRIDGGGDGERVTFNLSIDSALLQLFVPSITVVYDTSRRTLVAYHGISNMRDTEGGNMEVKIRFNHPRSGLKAALRERTESNLYR